MGCRRGLGAAPAEAQVEKDASGPSTEFWHDPVELLDNGFIPEHVDTD
jgi:hypothetical protein